MNAKETDKPTISVEIIMRDFVNYLLVSNCKEVRSHSISSVATEASAWPSD